MPREAKLRMLQNPGSRTQEPRAETIKMQKRVFSRKMSSPHYNLRLRRSRFSMTTEVAKSNMDERKNCSTESDKQKMLVALKKRDSRKVGKLLENGFNVDHMYRTGRNHNKPLIVLCADCESVEIAELLVGAGVDVNKSDSLGWTALHVACMKADLKFATFLLNNTNVNVNCAANMHHMTSLHVIWTCRPLCGAEPSTRELNEFEILSLLLKKDCQINRKDKRGLTALDRCIQYSRSAKAFLLLVESGAIPEMYENTLLPHCVKAFRSSEVVEKILQRESWYDNGETVKAFHEALCFCDSATRLKILQMFLNVKSVDSTGCHQFLLAASQKYDYEIIKYLLARGCPYPQSVGIFKLLQHRLEALVNNDITCPRKYNKNEAAHINEVMSSCKYSSKNCLSLQNLCRVKIRNIMCEKHKNSLLDLEDIDKLELPASITCDLKLFPQATINT